MSWPLKAGIAFSALAVAAMFGSSFADEPTPVAASLSLPLISRGEKVDKPSAGAGQENMCTDSRLIEPHGNHLRSILRVQPNVVAERTRAIADLSGSLARAKTGSGPSAIAILLLLQNCPSIARNFDLGGLENTDEAVPDRICSSVPTSFLKEPLSLLEGAAQSGSPEAQILYAQNAERVTNLMSLDEPGGDAKRRAILQNAERFAESAAADGVEEAYSFLAAAHLRGLFGSPQPAKAYAYASFLNRSNKEAMSDEGLGLIYGSITRKQFEEGQEIVASCRAEKPQQNDSYKNPFW